jgi:transcriptional regulator with XRE-family HTH domain
MTAKGGGMARPWVTSPAYAAAIRALVDVRKERDLSQRDLAERIGKPRSFISKIENRERRLDVVEFVALARALGADPAGLLTRLVEALPEKLDF